MHGTPRLMAALIYGEVHFSECCELRIKDWTLPTDLSSFVMAKAARIGRLSLPEAVRPDVRAHLEPVEVPLRLDRKAGLAGVWLPDSLDSKYPNAGREFGWSWVFPSRSLSMDPRAGIVRRHHLDESVVQKAVNRPLARPDP